MPAFMQVILSNPAAFDEAGAAMTAGAQGFRETSQAIRSGTGTAFASWKGATMTRAKAVTERFAGGVTAMARWISDAGEAAQMGGSTMTELVMALREGVEMAQSTGFLVLPTGQVFVGPEQIAQAAATGPGAGAVLEVYQAIARMFQGYFDVCVELVTAADEETARAIQALMLQLDSEIPFRSSIRAMPWFVQGGLNANNKRRGDLAEELNELSATANNEQILGTQVRIRRSAGSDEHMFADTITEDPDNLRIYEVKAGGSHPSPQQSDILPRVPYGGPHLDPGTYNPSLPPRPLAPGQAGVHLQRWDVDTIPSSAREEIYRNNYSISDILAGRGGPQAQSELSAWMKNPASKIDTAL